MMDNMDIFRFNGFNIKVDETAEPTKRISVLSQPFSKNTMLDKKGKQGKWGRIMR